MVMGDPAISDVYPSDCSDSESDWLNDTVVCHIDQRNINEQLNDEIEAMQAIVGEPDIGIDESFGDDFHDILQADEEPVSYPSIQRCQGIKVVRTPKELGFYWHRAANIN
uniref:Uncharacterized protein n=1 Tax=Spongospora subterranea TaxID=70186 RepID=A0A0H5RFN5_9EUKA|eukprot:CRZ12541.1 hypothetical protein [Spongospora subterranea]